MRLLEDSSTIHVEAYLCPAPGGRTQHRILEVVHQRVSQGLPASLSGLLCTADLQGRGLNSAQLLGEALAEGLAGQIDTSDCGVILAGDFFAIETADKMGASGDVRTVWQSFADNYRWCRSPDDYLDQVRKLLAQQPDILILHEAPAGQDLDQRGNAGLAACLAQASNELLVVCGHCHWPPPLSRAGAAAQILNVDSRALLLHSR